MKIAFIGLGIMGSSMAENIIRKHDDQVFVYDRLPEKTAALAEKGGIPCGSAGEAARQAEIIITMVPRSEHSRAVYTELLPLLGPGKTCIDMSTIDPSVSVEIAERVKRTGADFADAPVVKSKPAAIAGKLGIYVGSSPACYERILPILSYMGENMIRMGTNGAGLTMKICHNALVSQIQNGVNETLTLAGTYGIDVQTFARAISYGGGQNFYLDSKKDAIAAEDYTTAFSIENMHKDVHICMDMAKDRGLAMPGEANVQRIYDTAMEAGLGREDMCATIKVVKGK